MKFFLFIFLIYMGVLSLKAQESNITLKLDMTSNQYGLTDGNGNWISTSKFDKLKQLNTYFYYGGNTNSGNYVYRYDKNSRELIRVNYLLYDTKIYFNTYVIIKQYGNNGSKGIMDIYGNEILPAFYSNIWVKENYFLVEINNKITLYNQKGQKVFPESFKYIDIKKPFIYVKVEDKRFPNNERFIVYNSKLEPITQENWTIEGIFGKDNLLLIKTTNNQKFYIDPTGKIQIEYNPNLNYEGPFSNGFAIVSSQKEPKKFGFINTSGKIVIPLEYNEAAPFQMHYAFFSKTENGLLVEGLIDSNNRIVKIFPAKVISKSIYYDTNDITYYLSNLETYDADGNFKENTNPIK